MLSHISIFLCLLPALIVSKKLNEKIHEITLENSDQLYVGEWFVKFQAPWCPACRALEKDWAKMAEFIEPLNVNVGSVDITQEAELNGRFLVTSLPSIFHFKNGQVRQYFGKRNSDDLISYIEDADWEETPPLSAWRHPNAVPMKILSKLYSFSAVVKDFMDTLESKGYNQITIFGLLGLGTVIVGLFLGLLLVAITDFIWPQNYQPLPAKKDDDHGQENKSTGLV